MGFFASKFDLWKCMSKLLAQIELLHVEHIMLLDCVSKEICLFLKCTCQPAISAHSIKQWRALSSS